MNDPIAAFRDALASAGVLLAAGVQIVPDGKLHRARAADDKAGALSIWYNFHPDAPASGAAGNWRTGARLTWCGKRLQSLTSAERETLRLRIEEDKRRAQEATEARHAAASAKAIRIWTDAAPADPAHPYLQRKMALPGIARQLGDMLILPIVDFPGPLRGIQTISPTGEKRFTKGMHKQGAFIPVNGKKPEPGKRLLICEGWATGQTLAALSPGAVVLAALDCGNMQAVTVEVRRLFPALDIVICADLGEVGMTKAKAAAIASRARWIWPRLPADAPAWVNDFNDWAAWRKSQRQGVAS
ncbi:MAG: toprim domain-containing protein [Acidithiobacillus sp.]